jgi:hypothetical protein
LEKNVKKEIKYLKKMFSKDSNSPIFARLSDKYLEIDEVEKAIEICEDGLKILPY